MVSESAIKGTGLAGKSRHCSAGAQPSCRAPRVSTALNCTRLSNPFDPSPTIIHAAVKERDCKSEVTSAPGAEMSGHAPAATPHSKPPCRDGVDLVPGSTDKIHLQRGWHGTWITPSNVTPTSSTLVPCEPHHELCTHGYELCTHGHELCTLGHEPRTHGHEPRTHG